MRKFLVGLLALAATAMAVPVHAQSYMGRNLLVCGDASNCPWQRGTTSATITNSAVTLADYWTGIGGASSALVLSRVSQTGVQAFTNAHQMQRTAANADVAVLNYGQVLDTVESTLLQGKQVCLSFNHLKGANFSPSAGAFTYTVTSGTGALQGYASMVAGTWTGTATVMTGTVTPATTMQSFSRCAAVSGTATEIGVNFSWTPLGTAGAADLIQLNAIQLEIAASQTNPVATVFDQRPAIYERTLALRRAYVINEPAAAVNLPLSGTAASATSCIGPLPFPVQMRAAPTLTASAIVAGTNWMITAAGVAANTSAAATIGANTIYGASMNWTTAGMTAGQACILQGKGGTATLLWSADLQ